MPDPLSTMTATVHHDLDVHLTVAEDAVRQHIDPREARTRVDTFLIETCRHASAVCEVLLPAARSTLPDGKIRVRAYVMQCRRLEKAACLTKRRLYGELHSAHMPWTAVWSMLRAEYDRLHEIERALVDDLAAGVTPEASRRLGLRVHDAAASGPTRPHPHSRHTGHLAHLSRQVWARADRIWDTAEGRIVAGPGKKFTAPRRKTSSP